MDVGSSVPRVPIPVRLPLPVAAPDDQAQAPSDLQGDYSDQDDGEGYEDYSEDDGEGSWDDGSQSQERSFEDWEQIDPTAYSWRGLPSGSFDPVSGVPPGTTEGQAPHVPVDSGSTANFGPESVASYEAEGTEASSEGSWVLPLYRSGINYLNSVTLGPYVARALEALGQRVIYDPSVLPTGRTGDLGFLNPRGNRRGPANPVPEVPLSAVVKVSGR